MKKIELSTKPVVIQNKAIHTIEFILIYPVEAKNEYTLINNYLSHLLCESTLLIPDESEFEKEKLRKTILTYSYRVKTICKNQYLLISFVLPKENLVKGYDLEESFKFIADAIKHPIVSQKKCDKEKFEHAKEYFIRRHDSNKQEIYGSNNIEINKIIDPNEKMGFSYESFSKELDRITWKEIYEFYQQNILQNNHLVYVYGDISPDKVNYLFDKYLPQKEHKVIINTNYCDPLPIVKPKFTSIQTKFKQSQLVMEYQVVDMKEEDKLILTTIINILHARENNLIFNSLRTKNSLVYDAYVSSSSNYGYYTVEAFIDSKNKDKVISLVSEVMDSLRDEKFLSECLDKLIKALKVDLLREEDGLYTNLNYRIDNDLNRKTLQWAYDNTLKLDIKDIIKFLDRIKLTNTILFVEDNSEVQHD